LRQNVGEIEWQIFHQTLCAGNFSPGKQSLVKSTTRRELSNIILAVIDNEMASSICWKKLFLNFIINLTLKKNFVDATKNLSHLKIYQSLT